MHSRSRSSLTIQSTYSTSAPSQTRTVSYASQQSQMGKGISLFYIKWNKCIKDDYYYRVHEDLAGMRHGLHRDRVHRLHHQAGLHPHQQHHTRCMTRRN